MSNPLRRTPAMTRILVKTIGMVQDRINDIVGRNGYVGHPDDPHSTVCVELGDAVARQVWDKVGGILYDILVYGSIDED